jgi:hypothetical protein
MIIAVDIAQGINVNTNANSSQPPVINNETTKHNPMALTHAGTILSKSLTPSPPSITHNQPHGSPLQYTIDTHSQAQPTDNKCLSCGITYCCIYLCLPLDSLLTSV